MDVKGADLNVSGFEKSIVKVTGKPKRNVWAVSKHKANQKDSQQHSPGGKRDK